jgi:glycosyltransferase involved in cell wall biosynthesis
MIQPQAAKTLRVMHVYKDVYPPIVGGIEKQIDALRRGMPDVVSHVLVCARAPRTRIARVNGALEVRVAELGPRWLSVPVAPTFPRWIRRIEADLIHLHMPNPTGEVGVLLDRGARPVVVSYHADLGRQARFERAYRPLVDACLERSSAIIVGTVSLAESSASLRRHSSKLKVIPHCVDVGRYRLDGVPADRREALRRRYGEPLVIAAGRLVYYKGYEHLIDAARGLAAAVVIVGSGPERKRLVARAGEVTNVHFTGELDESDLIAHLAAADCFALTSTSRAESFGIAVAEAQAIGLPAVVSDTGAGTTEAIEDGVTGLVVPPGDTRALRDAMSSLLADEGRRRAMGAAARERAVARHALEDRAHDVRELYDQVLRSSGAVRSDNTASIVRAAVSP